MKKEGHDIKICDKNVYICYGRKSVKPPATYIYVFVSYFDIITFFFYTLSPYKNFNID